MRRIVLTVALLAGSACGSEAITDIGELDGYVETVVSSDAEACAMLRVAREATYEVLDTKVKLDRRAAAAIVERRDWVWFDDLDTLGETWFVGPGTMARLLNYVRKHEDWACGTIDVQLLAFNDFHGNLKPPSGSSGRIVTGPDAAVNRVDAGGAEFMATHLAKLRAANPNTVIVTAGDIIGASPLISALFHDEPTIESMNAMGLAIASVGNHEFDEGPDELLRMQYGGCHPTDGCQDGDDFAGADFHYLAANVVDTAWEDTIFPGYEIRAFRGARIAFIGMTLEGTPQVVTPAGVQGLEFLDEVETVNALVPELLEQHVNAIVVLLHEGGFATGLYNECAGISGPIFEIARNLHPAVDVVVSGHTNAAHVCDIDGRLVTSAASFGRLVTDLDLQIDEVTGEIVKKSAANVIVTRDVEKDAKQTALIAKYDTIAAPRANRVIAKIAGDLTRAANAAGESLLGDVIADGQLAATSAADKGGAVISFMNPGGIRTDLIAAQVSGGEQPFEVTYGEAFAVHPFGNTLVVLTLTGAELDALLEQQWSVSSTGVARQVMLAVSRGFSYRWSPAAPIGSRADELTLNGAPIDPAASYRVSVNSFLADGGDGFGVLRQGKDRLGGEVDLDALEAYLKANSPVAAPALDRVRQVTTP